MSHTVYTLRSHVTPMEALLNGARAYLLEYPALGTAL